MNHQFRSFPELVNGYELNPNHGYFSVIIPEATTNLCTNPSVELATTGWAAYGGAMAQTYDWQAFGAAGLKCTPAVATESGCYFGTVALTQEVTYTASIVIQGEVGKIYYIWFATDGGVQIGSKRKWIGTGKKQRIWVTYRETATNDRRVYIARDAKYSDQHVFYADALQVEAKAYPTTYCDGDQKGFVIGETAYQWTGIKHASASSRSAQTRSGGKEMKLRELGLIVLAIMGLGMAPLVDQSLPIPGLGEIGQGTGTMAREFVIAGALVADGRSGRHLQSLRNGLIDAFKPDLVAKDQPLILRYQACDEDGDPISESLDIVCKYRAGLEENWDNHQQERLALQFKMYLPLIQGTYSNGVELGYQGDISDFVNIGYRDKDGIWHAMGSGLNNAAYVIRRGPDGYIYVGGSFTSAGGVANTGRIARWSGTAWFALGTGMNGAVRDIVFGPDGELYATGDFTDAGGTAVNYVAKWDGANWSALGAGLVGQGFGLAVHPNGNIYAVSNAPNYCYVWNGVSWSEVGDGLDGFITAAYTIAIGPDEMIYVGGDGGYNVYRSNGVTWNTVGVGLNSYVLKMAFGPDGVLYAVGDFTASGDNLIPISKIGKWNGVSWSQVGDGLNEDTNTLSFDRIGNLYAGGIFSSSGGVEFPDSIAMFFNGLWWPVDVNVNDSTAIVLSILADGDELYVGGIWPLSTTATGATVTIPTVNGADAYPTFRMVGPGRVWQIKNYTTGASIYFNNLALMSGEIAVLDLNPLNISFTSNIRGNLMGYILGGSDLTLNLVPGENNISAFMFGSTTADSAFTMEWKPQEWSIDGAVIE